jgi:hypothetical protein
LHPRLALAVLRVPGMDTRQTEPIAAALREAGLSE